MNQWAAGKPLIFNDMWATKPEGYDDDGMLGRVIDAAIDGVERGRARRAADSG